jgi:hypothetical protein
MLRKLLEIGRPLSHTAQMSLHAFCSLQTNAVFMSQILVRFQLTYVLRLKASHGLRHGTSTKTNSVANIFQSDNSNKSVLFGPCPIGR